MATSAYVLVNGTPVPTTGQTGAVVTSGSAITIQLNNIAGVQSWSIQCTSTDEINSATAINNTASINYLTYTATFQAPTVASTVGAALQFTSVVNAGLANQATFTFGVFILVNGVRLFFGGESQESNATVGNAADLNILSRQLANNTNFVAGGDLSGSVTSQTVSKLQGYPLAVSSPTTGQVIYYNGTSFVNSTVTMSGDVTGNNTATVVSKIQGNTVASGSTSLNKVLLGTGSGTAAFTTITGDLTPSGSTAGNFVVSSISGNSPVTITPNLQFVAGASGPTINQASTTGTAASLTFQSQSTTSATGGTLNLYSGTGSTTPGSINLQLGNSNCVNYSTAGVTHSIGLQLFNSGISPVFKQVGNASASGTPFTITAQSSTTPGGTSATGLGGSLVFSPGDGSYASGSFIVNSGSSGGSSTFPLIQSGWNAGYNTQSTTLTGTGVYGRALMVALNGSGGPLAGVATDGTNVSYGMDMNNSAAVQSNITRVNGQTGVYLLGNMTTVASFLTTGITLETPTFQFDSGVAAPTISQVSSNVSAGAVPSITIQAASNTGSGVGTRGGSVNINGGNTAANPATAGGVNITGGSNTSGSGLGGAIGITAGNSVTGTGGGVSITAGAAQGGGTVTITAGSGSSTQGNIYLAPGTGAGTILGSILVGMPMLGDGLSSPYSGPHGEVDIALTASRALVASEYQMFRIVITSSTGAYTITFPLPTTAARCYMKLVTNNSTSTITLTNGGGVNLTLAASTSGRYWFSPGGVTLV